MFHRGNGFVHVRCQKIERGKLEAGKPERWQSGRMRRFAKPRGVLPLQSFQLLTFGKGPSR